MSAVKAANVASEASMGRPRWAGWVAGARVGDRAAFTALHDHFAGMVHGIAVARVPHADASDLVQDVFLTALQKLSTLEDDLAFGGWLATVARARVARFLRDRKVHDELPDEPNLAAPDRSGAPDAQRVLAALRKMPEAYAETLAMRLLEGLSGPEIAEQTGLTEGSVRVNLHRGMKLLREQLGWQEEVAR